MAYKHVLEWDTTVPPLSYHEGKNMDEMLKYVYEKFNPIFHGSLVLFQKSEENAEKLREIGNEYYRKRIFETALKYYNLSIMVAPHPVLTHKEMNLFTEMENETRDKYAVPLINPVRYSNNVDDSGKALGKAFANRSAIMFELKLYDKCIEEIDLAFDYGYPEEMKPYLEERKLRCIRAKQDETAASLNICSKVSNTVSEQGRFNKLPLRELIATKAKVPPKLRDPNPYAPALSSAVNISYRSDKGRGLYATREIHPGEVLGVEEAFLITMPKEDLSQHCNTCTRLCLTPLPCPGCCEVIFCSKTCRLRSLAEEHWLECKILLTVLKHGIKSRVTSFKLFKTFSFSQLKAVNKELEQDLQDHPEKLGFNASGKYLSSSYQSVFHLLEDSHTYSRADLFSECQNAFFIAKILEKSERFFVDDDGCPVPVSKEDIFEACKMLIVNYARRTVNGFQLTLPSSTSGTCLCPTLSLINHSCIPSATRLVCERKAILVADRPIAVGEEVTMSYGEFFHMKEKRDRIKKLDEKYHFTCRCEACAGNWPTFFHIPQTQFLCPKCQQPKSKDGFLCSVCAMQMKRAPNQEKLSEYQKQGERVKTALKTFEMFEKKSLMSKPSSIEDTVLLCDAIEVIFKYSAMPCHVALKILGHLESCLDDGLLWSLHE